MASTQSKADVAQTRVAIDFDREKLNRLMGLAGDRLGWTVAGDLPKIPSRHFSEEELETMAMRNRLDVGAARLQVAKLEQVDSLTKATRFAPGGISVGGDTEKNPDGSRVTGPEINLQVPVFDQGQAHVAEAEGQLRQARQQLQADEINARADVRDAHRRVTAARELADLYQDTLLPQRLKMLDLAQQQYNFMLKGAYDLFDAKQRVIEARRSTLEAQRDYWIARTALEQAVGGSLHATSVPIQQAADSH